MHTYGGLESTIFLGKEINRLLVEYYVTHGRLNDLHRTILPPDVKYLKILPVLLARTSLYKIKEHRCTTTSDGHSPPRSHSMFSTYFQFSLVQNWFFATIPSTISSFSTVAWYTQRLQSERVLYCILVNIPEVCSKLAYNNIVSSVVQL